MTGTLCLDRQRLHCGSEPVGSAHRRIRSDSRPPWTTPRVMTRTCERNRSSPTSRARR